MKKTQNTQVNNQELDAVLKELQNSLENKLKAFEENLAKKIESQVLAKTKKSTNEVETWRKELQDFAKARNKNEVFQLNTKALSVLTPADTYPRQQIPVTTLGVAGVNYVPNYLQNYLNSQVLDTRYVTATTLDGLSPLPLPGVLEGVQKQETDVSMQSVVYEQFKVAGNLPLTEEQLTFLPNIDEVITRAVNYSVSVGLHYALLNRIIAQCNIFNAAAYNGITTNANLYDLVQFMKLDYYTNGQAPTNNPNLLLFGRGEIEKLSVLKDTTSNYLNVRTMLNDMNDIVLDAVAAPGLVVDRTHVHLFIDPQITVKWGYANDDFIRNVERIVFEVKALVAFSSPIVGTVSLDPAADIALL